VKSCGDKRPNREKAQKSQETKEEKGGEKTKFTRAAARLYPLLSINGKRKKGSRAAKGNLILQRPRRNAARLKHTSLCREASLSFGRRLRKVKGGEHQ